MVDMTKAKKKTAALLMRIRANVSTAILTYLHYLIAWFSIEVLAGNNALLWFIAYLLVAVNVSNGMRHRAILEAIANASNNDKVDSHPLYAMRHNDKIDSHPLYSIRNEAQ